MSRIAADQQGVKEPVSALRPLKTNCVTLGWSHSFCCREGLPINDREKAHSNCSTGVWDDKPVSEMWGFLCKPYLLSYIE